MKKLIFICISIFIIWEFDIVDILLKKYFEFKYTQNIPETNFHNDKSTNSPINMSDNILMPEIKVKQYQLNKEALDNISIPHKKSINKLHLKVKKTYICDGRVWCSQMHSCEEATFFINHCPNTKMDGDGDGLPCERQWCR